MSGARPGRSHRTLGAAALVAGLLLAGCGDDGDADEGDAAASSQSTERGTTASEPQPRAALPLEEVDACALFTAEDFERVMGVAPDQLPDDGDGEYAASCSYTAIPDTSVAISAISADGWDDLAGAGGTEPASGEGYEGWWDPELGLFARLDGQDWYVQVIAGSGEQPRDPERSARVVEAIRDAL